MISILKALLVFRSKVA